MRTILALGALLAPATAQCFYSPDAKPASGACNVIPFGHSSAQDPTWSNQKYQALVTKAEMGNTKGRICDLAFAPCLTGLRQFATITIKLDHFQKTTLSTDFATNLSSPVTVLTARAYRWHSVADTWNRIGLQRAFDYDPAKGNLLLDIEVTGAGFTGQSGFPGYHIGGRQRVYANGWKQPPKTGTTSKTGALKVEVCIDRASTWLFGEGCGPANKPLALTFSGSSKLGSVLNVHVNNGPANGVAVVYLGANNKPPYPIDIPGLGFQGCKLHHDLLFGIATPFDARGTSLPVKVPIPNDNRLGCGIFFLQSIAVDPQSKPPKVSFSNYGRAVAGR